LTLEAVRTGLLANGFQYSIPCLWTCFSNYRFLVTKIMAADSTTDSYCFTSHTIVWYFVLIIYSKHTNLSAMGGSISMDRFQTV